jgi:hypothetical protein
VEVYHDYIYAVDSVEQGLECLAILGNLNSQWTAPVRRNPELDIVSHLGISDVARYLKSHRIVQTLHDIDYRYKSTKHCNTWQCMETQIQDIEIPFSVSKIAVKEESEDERELKEHDSGALCERPESDAN